MIPASEHRDPAQLSGSALDRRPLTPDPRPGLYVHVPFCTRICPYCDFSVVGARHPRRADFVDTLLREAEAWQASRPAVAGWSDPRPFGTVYLGGGTPSTLDPDERARLVAGLRERLEIARDARWTLEANPEHVDREFASDLMELGIDHVSLGVQGLDESVLRELGRGHGPADVERAVRALRGAGVAWISIDLIYAVNADLSRWQRQIRQAVELEPDHLSCYELTIHEGTRFGREVAAGRRRVVDEDSRFHMFVSTLQQLAAAGYRAYEVSNFARGRDARSPHNQKYWTGVPYLGLGPSAHSFDGHRRWWNRRSLRDWHLAVASSDTAIEADEVLSPREVLLERLMTGTRTAAGLDLASIRVDLGVDLGRQSGPVIERLLAAGRLEALDGGNRLVPTVTGLATADQLAVELDPGGL